MEKVTLSLSKPFKNNFDKLSKRFGISKSELLRMWISREINRYCPNCKDQNYKNCRYYNDQNPPESRCITDNSIGFCLLEGIIRKEE